MGDRKWFFDWFEHRKKVILVAGGLLSAYIFVYNSLPTTLLDRIVASLILGFIYGSLFFALLDGVTWVLQLKNKEEMKGWSKKEIAFSSELKHLGYWPLKKTENGYSIKRVHWSFKTWTIQLDNNFRIISMKTSINYANFILGGFVFLISANLYSKDAEENIRREIEHASK